MGSGPAESPVKDREQYYHSFFLSKWRHYLHIRRAFDVRFLSVTRATIHTLLHSTLKIKRRIPTTYFLTIFLANSKHEKLNRNRKTTISKIQNGKRHSQTFDRRRLRKASLTSLFIHAFANEKRWNIEKEKHIGGRGARGRWDGERRFKGGTWEYMRWGWRIVQEWMKSGWRGEERSRDIRELGREEGWSVT